MADPVLVQQRTGVGSLINLIPEDHGSWDKDPAVPLVYTMPLADKSSYKTEQGATDAPVYKGTALGADSVDDNITAGGAIPLGLEFTFLGRLLKICTTATGYLQPEGPTGKLRQFFIPNTLGWYPDSFQLVRKQAQGTVQIFRTTGNRVNTIHFPYATSGRATYEINCIGSGRELYTDLGGGAVDDGYVPASYFNQQMIIDGKLIVGLTNFDDTLDFGITRQEVGANQGYGLINGGKVKAGGQLGLIWSEDGTGLESNLNLYNMAVTKKEFAIDVVYTDLPLSQATQWFRRRYWARITRSSPDFGGAAGQIQEPKWMIKPSSNAQWAAEMIADKAGPYVFDATHKVLSFKDTGGAGVPVTLTEGSRTTDQVVTELMASGPFAAIAVADNYLNHLRVTHKTKGSAKSLAVDTAAVNSAHTIVGYTSTVYSGFGSATNPVPILYDMWSLLGASF